MLTAERLHDLLNYDPLTGIFYWRVNRSNIKAGSVAGHPTLRGYITIRIDHLPYQAHRLAWLYTYGSWPTDQIDHANRIKTDNRIANLREASRSENLRNSARRSDNTSGFKGVSWFPKAQKWGALIAINNHRIFLGLYDTREAAAAARREAADRLHGQFARHG